jgi:hypothetical protein
MVYYENNLKKKHKKDGLKPTAILAFNSLTTNRWTRSSTISLPVGEVEGKMKDTGSPLPLVKRAKFKRRYLPQFQAERLQNFTRDKRKDKY